MVDVLDENGNVIGQKESDDETNKWFIGQDPDRIWDYERAGVWQKMNVKKLRFMGVNLVILNMSTKTETVS